MKTKKKKLFCSFFICFCVFSCSFQVNAQSKQDGRPLDEIKLAEQIPEANLSTISTEMLIQEYLDSRYPGYILIYNYIHNAFEHAYNDFNGLRELLKRRDASQKLIEFYQRMDPAAYESSWDNVEKGAFTFSFVFIEVLISHESILEKMTKSEVKTFLNELLKKNEFKINHPEIFSIVSIQFNTYSIARLLEFKGKGNSISEALSKSPGVKHLLKTGQLQNNDVLNLVIQKAKEFLNIY